MCVASLHPASDEPHWEFQLPAHDSVLQLALLVS